MLDWKQMLTYLLISKMLGCIDFCMLVIHQQTENPRRLFLLKKGLLTKNQEAYQRKQIKKNKKIHRRNAYANT